MPDSPTQIVKALSFIGNLSGQTKIVDWDCGAGTQITASAQHTKATITALYLYAGSIVKFNATTEIGNDG